MRTRRRCLVAVLALLAAPACSTAGPYVTKIESAGNGTILVETARVKYNPFRLLFFAGISTTEKTSKLIKLQDR